MTSAHRPTWAPALGGNSLRDSKGAAPSRQYSAKDLSSHNTLKKRKSETGNDSDDVAEATDLSVEESIELEKQLREKLLGKGKQTLLLNDDRDDPALKSVNFEQEREEYGNDSFNDVTNAQSNEEEEDETDDDTEELMKELKKIKREREEAKAIQLEEDEDVIKGNPLMVDVLSSSSKSNNYSQTDKKKWNDDVIFKNQSIKGDTEKPKRFVNDLLRSDFHRKFMHKVVR